MRILDTDTCVEILRGNTRVIDHRRELDDTVTTTWVTASELYYGAAKSTNPYAGKIRVDGFLGSLEILGMAHFSAQLFGIIKAQLETGGNRLADADLWIAAITRRFRAILVTGNLRHYERIESLQTENWMR